MKDWFGSVFGGKPGRELGIELARRQAVVLAGVARMWCCKEVLSDVC